MEEEERREGVEFNVLWTLMDFNGQWTLMFNVCKSCICFHVFQCHHDSFYYVPLFADQQIKKHLDSCLNCLTLIIVFLFRSDSESVKTLPVSLHSSLDELCRESLSSGSKAHRSTLVPSRNI